MPRVCVNRHKGYTNRLFVGFSLRKAGLRQLWTSRWHRRFDTTHD
jgi:hypothetical protein